MIKYTGLPLFLLSLWMAGCQSSQESTSGAADTEIMIASDGQSFDVQSYLSSSPVEGGFKLAERERYVSILLDTMDHKGVRKVATHLKQDLINVTGAQASVISDPNDLRESVVIVGSVDQSPLIQQMAAQGKLDLESMKGKREKFIIQIVIDPLPDVEQALVIMGSDKRGTIYGMYDLSRQLGVSPWYWWADVPVERHSEVYVKPGRHTLGEPKIRYRGIFINDEAPALAGWAQEKFGGFNHQFYEKVYELILRCKGNYLWPAMWGRAIYDDDPQSPELADMYGVVIGTTHHEPLMRAHVEWSRYGEGPWNYDKNKERLQQFWREGIQRMGDNESIVSIGMRGDGDEPMTEGTAISLLENIVEDQRQIIEEETGKPVTETPQLWALYKEVQDYYDKGMRVPDDVTLLLCDDNWGNIRKLPHKGDTSRSGGYGIYYHFDYVGGPRNYKWINTNQISRTWEQMHLAYEYGAREIWIVNVGDIKPMEFPTSFFLDYAWNPEGIQAEDIPAYGEAWAKDQFGEQYATQIAEILHKYTQYNSRRKPELLSSDTYSLIHYREFERIVDDYNQLVSRAKQIGEKLPEAYQSAYFQLVLHPVLASANLNEMYYAVAKNHLYYAQGRASTNNMADTVQILYREDSLLTLKYHTVNNGKWNHMMSQTHIGYTYWQQPDKNSMPEVYKLKLDEPAAMGVAIEGSDQSWPGNSLAQLPVFYSSTDPHYYVEIFNKGKTPFSYEINSRADYLLFSKSQGRVATQERVEVSVDWEKAPNGRIEEQITITGAGRSVEVSVVIHKTGDHDGVPLVTRQGIALEAMQYSRKVASQGIRWVEIPQLGRTQSAITPYPVTADAVAPGGNSPVLEYNIFVPQAGKLSVSAVFCPTLNFHNNEGLRFALSVDDEPPTIINLHDHFTFQDWEEAVRTNTITATEEFNISEGDHTVKFWMVDAGLAFQRLILHTGEELPKSYLGPQSPTN